MKVAAVAGVLLFLACCSAVLYQQPPSTTYVPSSALDTPEVHVYHTPEREEHKPEPPKAPPDKALDTAIWHLEYAHGVLKDKAQ